MSVSVMLPFLSARPLRASIGHVRGLRGDKKRESLLPVTSLGDAPRLASLEGSVA